MPDGSTAAFQQFEMEDKDGSPGLGVVFFCL